MWEVACYTFYEMNKKWEEKKNQIDMFFFSSSSFFALFSIYGLLSKLRIIVCVILFFLWFVWDEMREEKTLFQGIFMVFGFCVF